MFLNLYDLLDDLTGKQVESIGQTPEADEGVRVNFTDGSYLDVGFSGGEGYICVNGKYVVE